MINCWPPRERSRERDVSISHGFRSKQWTERGGSYLFDRFRFHSCCPPFHKYLNQVCSVAREDLLSTTTVAPPPPPCGQTQSNTNYSIWRLPFSSHGLNILFFSCFLSSSPRHRMLYLFAIYSRFSLNHRKGGWAIKWPHIPFYSAVYYHSY